MIICAKGMDRPLGAQCQRVQKQGMKVAGEKERASHQCRQALAGRASLDAMLQQMALYPHYLESFLSSQNYILHSDGPLPAEYRHYIAIMAAARHHCSHLVSLHCAQFLRVGGNPLWLQGLESAPPRLRHLDHINKVLAHRPWLCGPAHIQALLKTGEQFWSLAELVQAVVLLAHCHALCSFVFGLEMDQDPQPLGNSPGFCFCDAANGNTAMSLPTDRTTRRWSLDSRCEGACLRERIQRAHEEDRIAECLSGVQHTDVEEDDDLQYAAAPSRFITEPEFGYQEFARRDEDHFQVFRVQDYSWEDHGFSLVNRLYSGIGHLLDERFRRVAALPWPQGADLRRAVWNYIHCMLGIRYDDYDYGEVNQLLGRDLKLYIKTVACFPNGSRTPAWAPSCSLLPSADKIHINLLLMEARLQAELLYALRAITQHMIG